MKSSRRILRQGMSWFLTAAMTAGMLFTTGITAGAATAAAGTGAGRKVTVSTASDAEEEELDEDGFLKDGPVSGANRANGADGDSAETATDSDAKRKKYPEILAYFLTDSPEHLKMQIFASPVWEGDKILYTFVTRAEKEKTDKNEDPEKALRDQIMKEKDRICEYAEDMPVIYIPDYLKDIGLGDTPGYFYFWAENPDYPEIRDIYAKGNESLASITWTCIMPRVIAKFSSGNEAYSGSVEKGTKIWLETAESYYDSKYEMAIQYTLDGTYPSAAKNDKTVPEALFAKDKDLIVYSEDKPIVINEDTILRAVAYPVENGEAVELPDGYDSWVVGTWNFTVSTGEKDQYEPNDTLGDAMQVDFPAQISATIHDEKDHDFFSFSNGSYGSVRLMLTQPAYCAYGLRLLNENGEILKECVLEPETAGDMADNQAIIYSGADGKGLTKDQKFAAEVWSLNGNCDEKRPYTLRMVPTVYASGGKLAEKPDFSELDLALSNYGLEKGNQTDFTGASSREISGGLLAEQFNYLSQWYGPVDESLEPYPGEAKEGEKVPESFAYHDHSASAEYHLQNAVFGLSPEYGRQEYIDSLKNMIYSYGSCTIAYEATDEGDNEEFTAEDGTVYRQSAFHYDPRSQTDMANGSGHTVQLVGWNDDLPKELFSHSSGSRKGARDFGMPEEDGGFLIKNSWGTEIAIDGFCWISYEDTSLLQDYHTETPSMAVLMEKAGQYDRLYLNDATGMSDMRRGQMMAMTDNYSTGSVEAGNVFTTDDHDQLLTAVSLCLGDPGVSYDVWLTANGETTKILSGCERYGGYYTKQLAEPVLLKANSDFILTEVLYADGGSLVGFPMGKGSISKGRAFEINPESGKIRDLSEEGYYPNLRALTVIPDYDGKPQRVCRTTFNKNYGTEVSRADGEVLSEYAAEAIEGNSLKDTLVSSAAGDSLTVSDLPASYDSRNYGIVTTVKNQGSYGTCWSFGTIATVESSVLLNGGTRMEYARELTLTSPSTSLKLTRDEPAATALGTASLDTANAYDGTIFWSYTGDTDSIEILTTCSGSGDEMELFRFTKPGKVTARATSGADVKLYKELTFTATAQGLEKLTLDPEEYEMKVGEELQLEPVITPEDVWDDTILYTSSDPTIAYVDKNGKITALKAGSVIITLEAGDQVLEATVTVTRRRRSGSDSSGYSYTGSGKQSSGPAETPGSWKLTETGWTFLLADGTPAKDLWILRGGKWYYMSASGIMKTGWLLDRGHWYYLDLSNGDMQTGLITESGYQYYLDPVSGRMLTGTVPVPGIAEPMRFNEILPPSPTYTPDPASGIWRRNSVDALPYGARIS